MGRIYALLAGIGLNVLISHLSLPFMYLWYILVTFMLLEGDVVSPGFFEDYLTTDSVVGIPWDNAEGRMFDFAINLQTMRYLQATNQLSRDAMEKALAFLKSCKCHQIVFREVRLTAAMLLCPNQPH